MNKEEYFFTITVVTTNKSHHTMSGIINSSNKQEELYDEIIKRIKDMHKISGDIAVVNYFIIKNQG